MAVCKTSVSDARWGSSVQCSTKDNIQIQLILNGFSNLHPCHVGHGFLYEGKTFKSMRSAILFKKAEMFDDNHIMDMAQQYTFIPSRLKDLDVDTTKPHSSIDIWESMERQVIFDITDRYLGSNPSAVAELLAISDDPNPIEIVVKGVWEPATANITAREIKLLTGLTSFSERNYIGACLNESRAKYLKEDYDKQPRSYYTFERINDTSLLDPTDGNVLSLFEIGFNSQILAADSAMRKRVVADTVDMVLAQLDQKSSVKMTLTSGVESFEDDGCYPPDVSRIGLAIKIVEKFTIDKMVKNSMRIQTVQYGGSTGEEGRKRGGAKVTVQADKTKKPKTKSTKDKEASGSTAK